MKPSLFLSFGALFAFAVITPAFAAFVDVSASHENYDAIEYVRAKGIVQGYADGTFAPGKKINRAELTKIIIGALFTPEGNNCFPDVKDQWFAGYVCAAKTTGIIGGYPDGTFKPDQNISFAEASKIIVRAFGREVGTENSVWYEAYIRSLSDANAIPLGIGGFGADLTRGHMAEIVFRLHSQNNDKASRTYESIAGLPEKTTSSAMISSASSEKPREYPYAFPLGADWQTAWNFYIDTKAPELKEEEGYNMLATLDLDRVKREEEQGGQFPEFLRVMFPKGGGSFFVAHFYDKPKAGVVARALGALEPRESLHLTYYVRFPSDFEFTTSGFLPVLGGGITTSNYGAFGPSDFSVGLYWTKKGEIGISGGFDRDDDSVQARITASSFSADNKWHRIDIIAHVNTVPVKRLNGTLLVKYDGNTIFDQGGIRYRSSAADLFDSIGLYASIGTYDNYAIAPHDMYVDLAGFVVAEE